MAQYIIAYRGGSKPASAEEGARQMERWKAWLTDLGDAVVNPGTPLGKSSFVTAAGVSDETVGEALTGFSIVEAGSREDALEMAKACPFVEMGTIELAEVMSMGG